MKLIEIAKNLYRQRSGFGSNDQKTFDEAISEAELMEREHKAFHEWLKINRYDILMGIKAAMQEKS